MFSVSALVKESWRCRGLSRDHKMFDKIVRTTFSTISVQKDGDVARGPDGKPLFEIIHTRERADAYSWTIRIHDVAVATHRVPDFATAITQRLRLADRRENVEIIDNPLRIEIIKRNPAPLLLTEYMQLVQGMPSDVGICVPGVSHGVKVSEPVALSIGQIGANPGIPHMLIAGITGSGKTTIAKTMLLTWAILNSPQSLAMIVIDPKGQDIANSDFVHLPHLARPVVTQPQEAVALIQWAASLIDKYVTEIEEARQVGRRWIKPEGRLLIFVDELAALVDAGGPSVTQSLIKIARLGRGFGLHLCLATQRPTARVLDGELLANILVKIVGLVTDAKESYIASGVKDSGCHLLPGLGIFNVFKGQERNRLQAFYASGEQIDALIAAIRRKWVGFAPCWNLQPAAQPAQPLQTTPPPVIVIEKASTAGRPEANDELIVDAVVQLVKSGESIEDLPLNFIRRKLGPKFNDGRELSENRAKRIKSYARLVLAEAGT